MSFNDLQNVFYAKLVTKVGTKRYWELWAKDIAQIAEQHIARIKALIADNGKHRRAFDQLMRGLHRNINPGLSEQDAIEMLSQHIISRPRVRGPLRKLPVCRQQPHLAVDAEDARPARRRD